MNWLLQIDYSIFHLINSTFSHPWLDWFFPLITDLHKTLEFKIIVPLIFLGLAWHSYKKKGVFIFLGLLVCLGVSDGFATHFIKNDVQRRRPFQVKEVGAIQRSEAGSFSFPSNHASNMFALATYMSFYFPFLAPVFFLVAFLVGYSRVYDGVHFPSDVLAGALLGILIGYLLARLVQLLISSWEKKMSSLP